MHVLHACVSCVHMCGVCVCAICEYLWVWVRLYVRMSLVGKWHQKSKNTESMASISKNWDPTYWGTKKYVQVLKHSLKGSQYPAGLMISACWCYLPLSSNFYQQIVLCYSSYPLCSHQIHSNHIRNHSIPMHPRIETPLLPMKLPGRHRSRHQLHTCWHTGRNHLSTRAKLCNFLIVIGVFAMRTMRLQWELLHYYFPSLVHV